MRLKKKKMLGIILSLVLVLGLMPGMSMTVEAASYTIYIRLIRIPDSTLTIGNLIMV